MPAELQRQERIKDMPTLEECYNLMDFEAVARSVMKKTAWAYYSSGADDEIVGDDSFLKTVFDGRIRPCERIMQPSIEFGSDQES